MEACVINVSVHISIMDDVSKYFKSVICRFLNFPLDASIVGSVVEFSPATRETGVRFPDNALVFSFSIFHLIFIITSNWNLL